MADPVLIEIPEWTWVKVATGVKAGTISLPEAVSYGRLKYYHTYRDTPSTTPTAITVGTIPEEAIRIFVDVPNQEPIGAVVDSDVYLMCANEDTETTEIGKVSVAL